MAVNKSGRRRETRVRRSPGFVLVSVLWISGILAAVAVSISLSIRSHALYTRNSMSIQLARSIADGLVRLTALKVATASMPSAGGQADGTWSYCRWSGFADTWISVQDQSGLVDLNTASKPLLVALLAGLGLSSGQAMDMVEALHDYRDADSVSRLEGVEAATYPGRKFGPKNGPFEAVEELDQIPGMTHALSVRLARLTTVGSQQTGFDFGTAPKELLDILGLTRTSVAGISFSSPRTSRERMVEIAVQLTDGTRFVRRSLVELSQQPLLPYVVKAWDAGSWPVSLPSLPAGGASCLAA